MSSPATTGATVEVILTSEITCPKCGAKSVEQMPTDACIVFHTCEHCHALLRPLTGDCCVFCSYGSVKCPPVQKEARCCA